ncbi:MAG: winged helix-turn-helix domain-containing protein, partial [Chryseobacterium sp.]|nr:winged helix-turn-helix domain-containing protein [Chryseobacterium sp.]
QALADYLGVERSAMSAELSKLKNEGILEYNKNWFKLLQK